MEIDITSFFENAEPWKFSHSIAEGGPGAGPQTWKAALDEAVASPLLKTTEELGALRAWARATGAWEDEEIAAWSAEECNALFIQLISGDIREANLDASEPDWAAYERGAEEGRFSGNIFRADDGDVYYHLSE